MTTTVVTVFKTAMETEKLRIKEGPNPDSPRKSKCRKELKKEIKMKATLVTAYNKTMDIHITHLTRINAQGKSVNVDGEDDSSSSAGEFSSDSDAN